MKLKSKILILISPLLLIGNTLTLPTLIEAKTVIKYTHPHRKETQKLESKNKKLTSKIKIAKEKNSKLINKVNHNKKELHQSTIASSVESKDLVNLEFNGKQEVIVNDNIPNFNKKDLSIGKGAWASYGDLDKLNRATNANALLNASLMPKEKRESLTVNPTGWHNKKVDSGWLYNRSHLIGYQLTGQNNNLKNLITGTRSLNSPEMLAHEMDIAYYLKQDKQHYVRYRVTPIFKKDELLARGVHLEAQSVGDDSIKFNVFIFNVQNGVTLDYRDGTSEVSKN